MTRETAARAQFEKTLRNAKSVRRRMRSGVLTGRNSNATQETLDRHAAGARRAYDALDATGEATQRDYERWTDLERRVYLGDAYADDVRRALGYV